SPPSNNSSPPRLGNPVVVRAVFVEVVAHVHDLVPFGERGGVVAEAFAHDRVELFHDLDAFVEQFPYAWVCLIGAVRVLLVEPSGILADEVHSFKKLSLVHRASSLSCSKVCARIAWPASRIAEFRVKSSERRANCSEGREISSELREKSSEFRAKCSDFGRGGSGLR